MAFRIYTKTGDNGTTGLIGGSRVSKAHIRMDACGSLDELNSYIGLIADLVSGKEVKTVLRMIQNDLFVMGAMVTLDAEKKNAPSIPVLDVTHISLLENEIDQMETVLPAMTHFILPGGHPTVSNIHIARNVCRRTERTLTVLREQLADITESLYQYINRLSDYLFVLARYVGKQLSVEEIKWIPEK